MKDKNIPTDEIIEKKHIGTKIKLGSECLDEEFDPKILNKLPLAPTE